MSQVDVFIVDDDADVRESLGALLESVGFSVGQFDSARAFLEVFKGQAEACLLTDIRMPGMDGLELQALLVERGMRIPVIVMTGHGDVPLAVKAMKAGAVDFLEKPFDDRTLISSIENALKIAGKVQAEDSKSEAAITALGTLTDRERDVLLLLVAGHANKVVAHKLDISPRTVEVHRARLMEKTKSRNLADLVRMALAAGVLETEDK